MSYSHKNLFPSFSLELNVFDDGYLGRIVKLANRNKIQIVDLIFKINLFLFCHGAALESKSLFRRLR